MGNDLIRRCAGRVIERLQPRRIDAPASSQCRTQTPPEARNAWAVYLLEVWQRPGPIEVGLCRLVEAEVHEPVLAGDGRIQFFSNPAGAACGPQ
jgi:hypothetical protein